MLMNLHRPLRTKEQRSVSADNPSSLAIIPEVGHTLAAWIQATHKEPAGVLIGGLALSLYTRPRATEDVDLLFLSEADIPDEVSGFKRTREHAFEEKKYQVEVEVCTPSQIKLPASIARRVFETSHTCSGLRVASIEALVAMKLFGALTARREHKDLGDVQRLLEADPSISLDGWPIPDEMQAKFEAMKAVFKG